MQKLTPADAAIIETFVVPRYLRLFGELALDMFLVGASARIAHLGCRTGYPDRLVVERADDVSIVGLDTSAPALELARNKVAGLGKGSVEYELLKSYPSELPSDEYSHALALHPIVSASERVALFREMSRLLYPGGQAIIALPVRGSFQEVSDMFREYALKNDHTEFSKALEAALAVRPNIELLSEELEGAGLDDVDVEIRQTELTFESGRAFFDDPVTRLLVIPEIASWFRPGLLNGAIEYLKEAAGKYWSENQMQLSLNVACASARKPTQ